VLTIEVNHCVVLLLLRMGVAKGV